MIAWVKLGNDRWLFKAKGATKEIDSFKQLYLWSMLSGIADDDIVNAHLELDTNTHNYAEFGMYKRFVLTKKI